MEFAEGWESLKLTGTPADVGDRRGGAVKEVGATHPARLYGSTRSNPVMTLVRWIPLAELVEAEAESAAAGGLGGSLGEGPAW